jgi:hypothetical protein
MRNGLERRIGRLEQRLGGNEDGTIYFTNEERLKFLIAEDKALKIILAKPVTLEEKKAHLEESRATLARLRKEGGPLFLIDECELNIRRMESEIKEME